MAELFQIAELVKVAIEDERSGVAFYSGLARKSDRLKEVFSDLADQEKHHLRRFEEMLDNLPRHQPPERHSNEYAAYLRTLTDSRAFPDELSATRAAEQCGDDQAALDLASRFERDTLLLMSEMRAMAPAKHSAVIDELIKEEQEHLVTLRQAREQLR